MGYSTNDNTPSTRKSSIMEQLNAHGEIRVTDMGQLFNTSVVTIRKDLDELEKEGLLERVHGGAIKNYKVHHNEDITKRLNLKKPS